jgi:hypothetical protein
VLSFAPSDYAFITVAESISELDPRPDTFKASIMASISDYDPAEEDAVLPPGLPKYAYHEGSTLAGSDRH